MDYYFNENERDDILKRAKTHLQRAYKSHMSGDINGAIREYKKSIELNPTAEAWAFLGWSYSFIGEYDKAIGCCQNAIELDPDYGNAYNDIGAYLISMGDDEEAIPWLKKAIYAKRYDAPHFPHYNLGRIYEKKGLWFEALDEYKEALGLQRDYEPAQNAAIRLQALLN